METITFTIDSKNKAALSKSAKIFHYIFGLFLIASSSYTISRFIGNAEKDIIVYSNVMIFLVGVLWIIMGIIGREFAIARKYISISNNSLHIKKNFTKEVSFPAKSITQITITPSIISVASHESAIALSITWLSYYELQQLKEQLARFCNENGIALK